MWTQNNTTANSLMYQSSEVQELINPNQTTQLKSKANIKQIEKDKVELINSMCDIIFASGNIQISKWRMGLLTMSKL